MGIKYIFSINSGRSGSDYLTKLLSCSTSTVSIHEGFPIMNGIPMVKFNNDNESELKKLIPLKLKQIRKSVGHKNKVYCETNHSFIKGWGYLIPDNYIPQEEIAVIILRRNIEDTIYSLMRVHDIPGSSQASRTWYLPIESEKNISHLAENSNPYEICKWYINEINLRAEKYKCEFPEITFIESDLEELNDYSFVLNIFKKLDLNPSEDLKHVCGRPLNKRNEWPRLTLAELADLSPYPNADSLSPEARDKLLENCLFFIKNRHYYLLESMEPNYAMGGTLALSAISIVSNIETILEEKFRYSLKYSGLENTLILEIVRTISPYDFVFVFAQRCTEPFIHYNYDFNIIPNVNTVILKLGIRALPSILRVALKGMWGRDYTHRLSNS